MFKRKNDEADRQIAGFIKRTGVRALKPDVMLKIVGPARPTMDEFVWSWVCWRRYGIPFRQLVQQMKKGNLEAKNKVYRLTQDYWKWRFGKLDLTRAKPKRDQDHHGLFELGLSLGLNRLTENELADCFDAVCPCEKLHSPEALKKTRNRIREALGLRNKNRPRSPRKT